MPPELPPTPTIDVGRKAEDLQVEPNVGWTPFRKWMKDSLSYVLKDTGEHIYPNERELLEAYLFDNDIGPKSEDGTPIKIEQGILQWEKEHGPLDREPKPEPPDELPSALRYCAPNYNPCSDETFKPRARARR